MMRPVGILGGTFDPVHYGHLRAALELGEALDLAEVRLLPSSVPPHRPQPQASVAQRLAMLQLAVAGERALRVDTRELERSGPSYMVDTLRSLREELGPTPVCLLLGVDAFLGLPGWYCWQELIGLAHLVVMHRPGWSLGSADAQLTALLAEHKADSASALAQSAAGRILLQPVTQLDISATALRELIAAGRSPRYLLPEAVWDYIRAQGLYRNE